MQLSGRCRRCGGVKDGSTGALQSDRVREKAGVTLVTPKPEEECKMLWYFDEQSLRCRHKQFCGLYMYNGLHTFETEEDCKAAFQKKEDGASCAEGYIKCEGFDCYVCFNSKWALWKKNASECGFPTPTAARVAKPTPKPTPVPLCTEGETKCEDDDLYQCSHGKWRRIERNSIACGYTKPTPKPTPAPTPEPEPICTGDETKCEDYNLFQCHRGRWRLKERNSPTCGYTKPTPKCIDHDLYFYHHGRWRLKERNSPQCKLL